MPLRPFAAIALPGVCLPGLLLLSSCVSPPKPPGVDESHRRPVNAQLAVELQVCRHDLHDARLAQAAADRHAQSLATSVSKWAAELDALHGAGARQAPATRNRVYAVRFEFGSTQVELPSGTGAALVAAARSSPLVLLRGRTDGEHDTPVEARIARERAEAVRDYLVVRGVDATHIRVTYQPTGDRVAENLTASGRRMNRRVEIELYRELPDGFGNELSST